MGSFRSVKNISFVRGDLHRGTFADIRLQFNFLQRRECSKQRVVFIFCKYKSFVELGHSSLGNFRIYSKIYPPRKYTPQELQKEVNILEKLTKSGSIFIN